MGKLPLQNIPIRTALGRAIRDAWFDRRVDVAVNFDYGPLELATSEAAAKHEQEKKGKADGS